MRSSMLRFAVAASVLLIGGPVLADAPKCEPEKVAQKYPELAGKTLLMGADGQTPPYAFLDPKTNTLVGSDIDLAKKVFDCIGVKYEIRPAAWSGIFPSVVAGQMDLMFYIYYNAKRVQQADFVVYMKAGTGAITQKGNPKNIKSNDDLCGKTVAVGLGTVEEAQMKELGGKCVAGGKETVTVMTYPDHAAGFRLVANNRADIMLTDLALVDRTIADNPTVYERAYGIISGFQIGTAVKKGNAALAQALLDGLKAVQASGGQQEVFKKYGVDPALELPAELKTN
ncbi:polar amino acid transport system substrate-binding protein [Angulomicrobium tetraedrale]|uniref:Polar amino acid transport system substrate-binding protein n=1 Tax=Ancylobacter tetraedralis TaxID=217068 RepID=A0A839ZA48_9HYPH|nr:ABC transporter substrate-binding protein [Ancylobacter tetraedralis]MBB3771602.1 polar amino acid transport system substrate-binding protein [Ancylobacter tetraedralis]